MTIFDTIAGKRPAVQGVTTGRRAPVIQADDKLKVYGRIGTRRVGPVYGTFDGRDYTLRESPTPAPAMSRERAPSWSPG